MGGWLGALCQEMGRDVTDPSGRFGLSRTGAQRCTAGSVRSPAVCLGGCRGHACVHACACVPACVRACAHAGVRVTGGEFG